MIISLVPNWLQGFEKEAGYMTEPKVKCLVCQKFKRHWLVFTGKEALEHTKLTGHNSWEIIKGKDK